MSCCLGYHGNRQDAKFLPSLKINFRHPPVTIKPRNAVAKKCTLITPVTVLNINVNKSHVQSTAMQNMFVLLLSIHLRVSLSDI